ncbi:polygalacturonate 4-alpha-galacturonosyltransferase [Aureococcus anophagefferens]|nr:polygalacturonate 4-alpha-galacturonosyltransferase [Aureococcus anophagefferens]
MLPRLNYARFFLGDVLKNVHGKVLYLDTDTIVHGDVAELVDAALAGGAPAVAARRRPQTFIDDFNAGVVVVDLAEWDARNLTATTLEWMALNLAHGLYTKGSNPPLVLAVAGDFERLDARWNCPAPRALPLRDACVPERLEACLLDAGLDSAAEAAPPRDARPGRAPAARAVPRTEPLLGALDRWRARRRPRRRGA